MKARTILMVLLLTSMLAIGQSGEKFNVIGLNGRTADPTSSTWVDGSIYFNSAQQEFFGKKNGVWTILGTGTTYTEGAGIDLTGNAISVDVVDAIFNNWDKDSDDDFLITGTRALTGNMNAGSNDITNINSLSATTLTGIVRFTQLSTAPGFSGNGYVYFNDASDHLALHDGLSYRDLAYLDEIGGGSGVTDGDKGDITVSGSGATWTIDDGAVGTSKILDATIVADDLSASAVRPNNLVETAATPSAGWIPTYSTATQFEWVDPSTVGSNGDMLKSIYDSDDDNLVDAIDTNTISTTQITDGGVTAVDIANGVVDNTKLSTVPANTIKGNDSGTASAPQDLTMTEMVAMLDAHFGNTDWRTGTGLSAPIDATDIANGTVNDTEFQYLANVAQDIQQQIDSKVAINGSTTMSGDLSFGNSQKAINLVDPTNAQDAATKNYVDTVSSLLGEENATASRDAVLTDADGLVNVNNASAVTYTVPTNATVAFPVGTMLTLFQEGDGPIIISYAGGVTGDEARTFNKGHKLGLWKTATDTWQVVIRPVNASLTQATYDGLTTFLQNVGTAYYIVP